VLCHGLRYLLRPRSPPRGSGAFGRALLPDYVFEGADDVMEGLQRSGGGRKAHQIASA